MNELTKVRLSRKLSIRQAAALADIPESSMGKIEKGEMPITDARLYVLADIYECFTDDLLCGLRVPVFPNVAADNSRPKVPKAKMRTPVCVQCKVQVNKHYACQRCEVLLHLRNEKFLCNCGVQHGAMKTKSLCTQCHHDLKTILVGASDETTAETTNGQRTADCHSARN